MNLILSIWQNIAQLLRPHQALPPGSLPWSSQAESMCSHNLHLHPEGPLSWLSGSILPALSSTGPSPSQGTGHVLLVSMSLHPVQSLQFRSCFVNVYRMKNHSPVSKGGLTPPGWRLGGTILGDGWRKASLRTSFILLRAPWEGDRADSLVQLEYYSSPRPMFNLD